MPNHTHQRQLAKISVPVLSALVLMCAAAGRTAAQDSPPAFPPELLATVHRPVDREDDTIRLVILASDRPVILDVRITIDGRPFYDARERLLDDLLHRLDSDRDGRVTWDEALRNRRFARDMLAPGSRNGTSAPDLVRNRDVNQNGRVDRGELRFIVENSHQSDVFDLSPVQIGAVTDDTLFRLFDADSDGVLSRAEIEALPLRLQSRDENGDDLLDQRELLGPTPDPVQRRLAEVGGIARGNSPTRVILLGHRTDWNTLYTSLRNHSVGPEGTLRLDNPRVARPFFEPLDLNRDGLVESAETLSVPFTQPDLVVEINLGKTGSAEVGPILRQTPAGLTNLERIEASGGNRLLFELAATRFDLSSGNSLHAELEASHRRFVEQEIAFFDVDRDGAINREEARRGLSPSLDELDSNGDGKVDASELLEDLVRHDAPQLSMAYAAVDDRPSRLFRSLDQTGDLRLNTREIREAPRKILSFDRDGDGRVTRSEGASLVFLSFHHGEASRNTSLAASVRRLRTLVPSSAVPEWFFRMDRNEDGDLTPREFLGTPEQFAQIDTNNDGFIDRQEAALQRSRSP